MPSTRIGPSDFVQKHGHALQAAAIVQGIALMECGGGIWYQDAHRVLALAYVVYWIAILLFMLRGADRLTETDRQIIRGGWVVGIVTFAFSTVFSGP